ncbi:MAG: hypothetical protein GC160_11660 [Acidobacteria bacterium]|nr:hypothetical protein [Acidobacteriota bacterium]
MSAQTLSIELDSAAHEQAVAKARAAGYARVEDYLRDLLEDLLDPAEEEDPEKTRADFEAGLADVEAGRVRDAWEFLAELKKRHDLPL